MPTVNISHVQLESMMLSVPVRILWFRYQKPDYLFQYSIDDQCALCGQLMGISEFLKATLSRSAPRVFRFEHDKFALKRAGAYTFVSIDEIIQDIMWYIHVL